jgi:hypothetical protein
MAADETALAKGNRAEGSSVDVQMQRGDATYRCSPPLGGDFAERPMPSHTITIKDLLISSCARKTMRLRVL